MIEGYFDFSRVYDKELKKGSLSFYFKNGFICSSEYFYLTKSISVSFLIRRQDTGHYIEFFNKERLGEMYSFSSNLSLLKDPAFEERLLSKATILILYDEELNEISIVRDAFGIVPLYYCLSDSGFGFSTDLQILLNNKGLPSSKQINTNKISGYLTHTSNGATYTSDTFFKNIKAVLPGHFAHYSAGKLLSERLVHFKPQRWEHLTTVEEFGEEFRYLFSESVSNNIIKHTRISSHLSGGLDSSSVSSMIRNVAPQLNFNTLYAETNTQLTNESHYADKVAKSINSSHFIVLPSTQELDLSIKNIAMYGFPEHMALSSSLQTGLMIKANELKSDLLMTGTDGDSIVGQGFNYLNRLFIEKRWAALRLALSERAAFSGGLGASKGWDTLTINQKERRSFLFFLYQKISEATSVRQALEIVYIAKSKFGVPTNELFKKGLKSVINRITFFNSLPASIHSQHLPPYEKKQAGVSFPLSPLDDILPNKYSFSLSDVFYNQAITMNEENFYLARDNNIELGYPFYNTQLFELCMAVPDVIKYSHGQGRGHLREAMRGVLIDDIRNRPDKGIYNEYGRKAALRLYAASGDFLNDSNEVWGYVDKSLFEKCVKLFSSDSHPSYIHNRTTFFINRTIYLSIWLSQQK